MDKNKKKHNIIAWIFIIIPFLHIFLYSLISPAFKESVLDFFSHLIFLSQTLIDFKSAFFYLWLLEFTFFIIIGIKILISKKNSSSFIALFFSLFVISYITCLIKKGGYNISWHILPLIFSIYTLITFIYIGLSSIRKFSLPIYKINAFKPYFRHRCYLDVELSDKKTNFSGKITNISNKGFFILSNQLVQIGDKYNLKFNLLDDQIKTQIEIVRIKGDNLTFLNGFGAKIINIDNKSNLILTNFLKNSQSIQIYRPRYKNLALYMHLFSTEGIIKNKIYDISETGVFIISDERWDIDDEITGYIEIDNEKFDIRGNIVRKNDKEDISLPKGYAIAFDQISKDFEKKLKSKVK